MKKKTVIQEHKGHSFSDAAMAIQKKYKNAAIDLIEKNSMEQELSDLMKYQEQVKLLEKAKETFQHGGKLKYAPGGLIGDPTNPKKTFSTLEDQPPYQPELYAAPPLDLNNLGSGLFGQPQMPTHPNQATPLYTNDGVTQTTDDTILTRDNPVTLSNNNIVTPRNTGEMSAYTPALIGQGLSTAISAGILAGGYDKVAPVENPYEAKVKQLLASRGIDSTQQRNQILSAYNASRDNLDNVRSANVRNALDANLMNITQDNLAESKLQEQQINQGYKADFANVLNNLGQQKAGARTYAEQLNNQSKSNWQGGVSELGKHLADIGLSQTTLKLNNVQQTAIANIMSQKYPDFVIGDEALKSYLNGTYTDAEFVKLKQAATKNPELQSVVDFATFQKQQKEIK